MACGAVAVAAVFGLAGVVAPATLVPERTDLRAAILADHARLSAALSGFARDTGVLPKAVFDLTEGYDGGLLDATFVPAAVADAWRGPYIGARPSRPTPASFWSVAEPQLLLDLDRDGEADESCLRLHRGYGEIDDDTAAWLDGVLDDGDPQRGHVRVTPTWIWFRIVEL